MPDEGQVPWQDGEFDEEKAKKLVLSLRSENDSLKSRNKDLVAKSKTSGSESEGLRKERDNLKIQLETGLSDRQIARLVGDTIEEKLEDAKAYAEENGIELRSLLEPEAEGTAPEGSGAEGDEDEQEKTSPGMHYRAPAQRTSGVPEVDYADMATDLVNSR